MLKLFKRFFSINDDNNSQEVFVAKAIEPPSSETSIARTLLKEATKLKREKKYDEACEKLKEAYSADDSNFLMIEERLRLPMYLQLAGRNDEGWAILNELNIKHHDAFSQLRIADQMRIFLQKEKKFEHAILFGAWVICKRIEVARFNIESSESLTDEMSKIKAELGISDPDEVDPSYDMFIEQIERETSLGHVKEKLRPLLKKAKLESKLNSMSTELYDYLNSKKQYDLAEVRDIVLKRE